MRDPEFFGDARLLQACAYCGAGTLTRDHVPARVFLDEPNPENLPIVPACEECNRGASVDEEYMACLVDYASRGSVDASASGRAKVGRIRDRKPALAARLEAARESLGDQATFRIEVERIRRVAIKLARGHALFELSEPLQNTPEDWSIRALDQLSAATRNAFEASVPTNIWPEVGSRAMSRLALSNNGRTGWVELQKGRYRYLTSWGARIVVRFVMSEFLAGEVSWRTGSG